MAKNVVNGVVQFVMGKYVKTEPFREGLRTGTRANFHMEAPDATVLLQYISDREGLTMEQALTRFTTLRGEVLQAKAKSPKETGYFLGTLIAFFLSAVPLAMLMAIENAGMWLNVVAAALLPLLFFLLFTVFAWQPRRRAMESVWKKGGTLEERIEELHQVQDMTFLQMVGEYQKPVGVIVAVLALAGAIALPTFVGDKLIKEENFHKTMTAVTVSSSNRGTRYVVYDVDDGKYVCKYLNTARQAYLAEDVRGVLRIESGELVVGRYEGQGNAYKRYVTIELVDQRTGRTVMSETIYGSEPPNTISVNVGARNQHGYGSRPSTSEIEQKCESMIRAFERTY